MTDQSPQPDNRPVVDLSQLTGVALIQAEQMRDAGTIIATYGPTKSCPDCGVLMLASIMTCADCGHKF